VNRIVFCRKLQGEAEGLHRLPPRGPATRATTAAEMQRFLFDEPPDETNG
jgi:Fe-S cluster biosynthesis and repair protein YggX